VKDKRFTSCPKYPDQHQVPLSLHGYCGVFSGDKMVDGIWLRQHLLLVVGLQMSGAIPPPPICLHGVYRDNFTFTLCVLSKSMNFLLFSSVLSA